jgi:hypothetical protein
MNIYPEFGQVAIVGLMILVPVCLIFRKAGFNPIWGFLVFIPGFGLLLVFMLLAFSPWPNLKNDGED